MTAWVDLLCTDTLIGTLIDALLLTSHPETSIFAEICLHNQFSAKKTVEVLLRYLADQFLNRLHLDGQKPHLMLAAVAGVIRSLAETDTSRTAHFVDWCTTSSGAGLGDAIGIRRAVIAALTVDKEAILKIFQKCLALIGDNLYIKHTALLQQEGIIQSARISVVEAVNLLTSCSPRSAVVTQCCLFEERLSPQIPNGYSVEYLPHDYF